MAGQANLARIFHEGFASQGTFFLNVNRYKASFREIASEGIYDVELFR
jgi:hypothetical protein